MDQLPDDGRVVVPRPSWKQRVAALVLLLLSAGLLYYSYLVWRALY